MLWLVLFSMVEYGTMNRHSINPVASHQEVPLSDAKELVGRGASRFFTNNMIFLECGGIALFEAFYMFRDHNHVKMKF